VNGVQILLIIGVGIAVSALAKKRGIEPGMIIVVLAAAASFLPGVPRLQLEPELILAIVVPPLLYSAARGASFSSFGANLHPILALGVLLVIATTAALGLVASWLLPSVGLAVAFLLGAVLAPPDTITSVSHGDEMGLPRRVTAILTGESLVNDATALTLFSIAVSAVNGEQASWELGVGKFFYTAIGGVVIGLVFGVITLWIRKRLGNSTLETSLVLLLPFTAYLTAEEAGTSGILAVVAASFSVTINLTLDPKHQYDGAYQTRLQESALWPVVDFLLETFVFAYIGLQLRFVLSDLAKSADPGLGRTLITAGVLLAAAIAIRFLGVYALFGRWALSTRFDKWMLAHSARERERARRRNERHRGGEPLSPPTGRETFLVGWTGMRGILTLAAAAAIPEHTTSGAPFPGRDAIQAVALIVTLGTLLLQGTTLRVIAKWLNFDLSDERAEAAAMMARGREVVAATPGTTNADFEAQRLALGQALADHRVDEESARALIEDIDLRQAAQQTNVAVGPGA
jgi:Na+/H+ antiporter